MTRPGFDFTLILGGVDVLDDNLAEKLFAAGCDDCTPSSSQGVVRIAFTREAYDIDDALQTAISQVESTGVKVRVIESCAKLVELYDEWLSGRTIPPIPRGGRGCGTPHISDRMRSVKILWHVMNPELQALALQYYSVEEADGHVLVNML